MEPADAGGVTWDCEFSFAVRSDDDLIRIRYTATPRHDTPLYRLDGPVLYAGEAESA